MKRLLLFSLLLGWGSLLGAEDATRFGRPVVVVDNGLVELAVTPEIGGRVLAFDLLPEGWSAIYVARHNIALQPEDQWEGAEYGGISDIGSHGWPGPFWGLEYDVDHDAQDDLALTVSAEADGMMVERTLRLLPESTALQMRVVQTNTSDQPRPMTIRTHSEFALGDRADDVDAYYHQSKDGLTEFPYRLGMENPRLTWDHPVEKWHAVVDREKPFALVRVFEPYLEGTKFLVWHGHNEGGPVRDEKGGFYAIDRFDPERDVPAGESLESLDTFYFVRGLTRVDWVNGLRAGALVQDKSSYGPGETATITVLAGSAVSADLLSAELILQPEGGKATVSLGQKTLAATEPGQSTSVTFSLPVEEAGRWQLTLKDAQGQLVAQAEQPLNLDAENHADAKRLVAEANTYVNAIGGLVAAKGLSDQPMGKAQLELAASRLAGMEKLFNKGKYTELTYVGSGVIEALKLQEQALNDLSPSTQSGRKRIAQLSALSAGRQ